MVANDDDGSPVLCIVRDMTVSDWQYTKKFVVNVPLSTTGQQLVNDVAAKCHYKPDTFELILQRMPQGDTVFVHQYLDATLPEIGFRGDRQRNNMIITDKNGTPPQRIDGYDDDDLTLGASASPVARDEDDELMEYRDVPCPPPLPPPPPSYTQVAGSSTTMNTVSLVSTRSNSHSTTVNTSSCLTDRYPVTTIDRYSTGFVGLVNQAMTCYLNSLLQTLYMTPEFRNALYRWEFDGCPEEAVTSIPYQLQKLFLLLQTSKRQAVETTELTRSFGWDSSEAWQQHDVQELCRVMFDALEQKFHNTGQADLINRLYQGKLKDYVKCQECGHESAREDAYLDIPLPVRPFGATEAYGSVEEALQAFVQPELLEGSNQYFCERCNKKCDAHKGLKFISFPYLLTLQLKRFDFDYSTLHRIKLNDRVTFPEVLNLNPLIKIEGETCHELLNDDASTTDSGSALEEEAAACTATGSTGSGADSNMAEDDEGIDLGPGIAAPTKLCDRRNLTEKGPHVYELFSIMVHSGSANGGHYYAYIKNFRDGNWYCFNDQLVQLATVEDIKKTYGGGASRTSYYSGVYSSSTNAYMLMYRQIDKELNAEAMLEADFLPHLKKALKQMQIKEEEERQQREMERHMIRTKVFYHHPLLQRLMEHRIRIHKDETLLDLTKTAQSLFNLDNGISLDRCRLVKYDESNDYIECSYDGQETLPIGEVLTSRLGTYTYSVFLLEVRPPDKPFMVYKPDATTVKVHIVNLQVEEIESALSIRASQSSTLQEFKALVAETLGWDSSEMRLIVERYYNDLRPLENMTNTLADENFSRSHKVFVCNDSEDNAKQYEKSMCFRILDRYEHTICLNITLPDVTPEILHSLSISSEILAGGDPTTRSTPRDLPGSQVDYDSGNSGVTMYMEQLAQREKRNFSRTQELLALLSEDALNSHPEDPDSGAVSPQPQTTTHQRLNSDDEDEELKDKLDTYTNEENLDEDYRVPFTDYAQFVNGYFRVTSIKDPITEAKMLRVYIDRRTTLASLKKNLEPYVGVQSGYFKVYRVYTNNTNSTHEYECTKLNETLSTFGDETQIVIKLGRALKKGEYRVKVYQLFIHEAEPAKFLVECILANGQTVLQAKKEILAEIKETWNIDIPLNRCRLRKKNWQTPSTIYLNDQQFDTDIPIFENLEIYLETLQSDELMTSPTKLSLYARHWHPATLQVDPIQEIILQDASVNGLKQELSRVSGIPIENVEFAKGQGSFPYEVPLLSIDSELEWNPDVVSLNSWPVYICDDGHMVYFKDGREALKSLTEEEKKEIINKDNVRLQKANRTTYSPRKERALKIYTDRTPAATKTTRSTGTDPDLD